MKAIRTSTSFRPQGGTPKRLTYHPGADAPVAWSPDGKQILFRSNRTNYSRITQLFTISVDGGFPTPVDLPMAYDGSFSADSSRVAYMPISPAFEAWKRYRGGETTSIWLANLSDAKLEKIPRENSNDFNPLWIGDKVYFLSDRSGPVSLFSYDTATKKVTALVHNDGFDMKSASGGPGRHRLRAIWLHSSVRSEIGQGEKGGDQRLGRHSIAPAIF